MKKSLAFRKWKRYEPTVKFPEAEFDEGGFNDYLREKGLNDEEIEIFKKTLTGAFFKVLLNDKKFSLRGLGILRLVFTFWHTNRGLGTRIDTGVIFSDPNKNSNRNLQDGALRCLNKDMTLSSQGE